MEKDTKRWKDMGKHRKTKHWKTSTKRNKKKSKN